MSGRKKLNSARDRIRDINPNVQVDLYDTYFTSANAREIVEPYDIVIDGTDNFPTRYLSNDICVFLKKPNIYGSIFRFDGQCTVFAPVLGGPCYRCMFPEPPPPGMVPSCAEGGVLGVLPGIIGVMQAIEAVKLIIGIGEPLIGRMIAFDALKMKFREFKLRCDPKCPVCGENPTITELIDYDQFCGIPEANKAAEEEAHVPHISVQELKAKLDRGETFQLIDVREPYEWDICRIPGAKLIPLGQLPARLSELDSADEIVLQCKSGARSAQGAAPFTGSGLWQARQRRGRHRGVGGAHRPERAQILAASVYARRSRAPALSGDAPAAAFRHGGRVSARAVHARPHDARRRADLPDRRRNPDAAHRGWPGSAAAAGERRARRSAQALSPPETSSSGSRLRRVCGQSNSPRLHEAQLACGVPIA